MNRKKALMIWMLGIPLAFFLGGRAEPFSSGITGFSGSGGAICTTCHSGGIAPAVTLLGPTIVAPNTIHTYTLRIAGGQQNHGGLDVSASGGTLSVIDGGTQLIGSEITHTTPRPAVAGVVTFSFNWQAPALPGTITIFGAGNSVNRNFSTSGDNATATTLQISVQSAGGSTPGESAATGLRPLLVTDYDSVTGDLSISFESGCETDDNNLYYGSLDQVSTYAWSDEICSVGTTGSATINPVGHSVFFVVVGNKSGNEGSYGRDHDDIERTPFGANICGEAQDLSDTCVP